MRVLLSTIGSRGDVQPMLALAVELRECGHESRLCAPPDFRELIEGYGFPFVPVGPEVRHAMSRSPASASRPSPEAIQQLMTKTIADQFSTLGEAAVGCDVIVASTALQYAAHSIAEQRRIPYFFAAYSPIVLPSRHHAPPPLPGQPPANAKDNQALWDEQAQRWNEFFGSALNEQRSAAGLEPVPDVRAYMFTDRPMLAADPTLAPWPTTPELQVTQTGAWMLPDERPLPEELSAFLESGEPPIYFGFGSVHVPQETGRIVIEAARILGRRAIVSRGWAGMGLVDAQRDCMAITEVNLQTLFRRVAVVVHHGGAGTTTTAARAGAPQVVVPHNYDQHYFADRIAQLGVGVAHAPGTPSTDSLVGAIAHALQPEIAVRARTLAPLVRSDGGATAAAYVTR